MQVYKEHVQLQNIEMLKRVEMCVPSNGFIIIPPVAGIEDQDISSDPFLRVPVESVNLDRTPYLAWWVWRGLAYTYEERRPVIFDGYVILLKPNAEEAFVSGYGQSA